MNKAELLPEVRRTLPQEFFDFLKTFGIIGLAIAFVICQAASRLVTAIVNDIIDPIIGLFLPAGSLESMSVNVTNLAGSTRVQIWRYNIKHNRLHHCCFVSISRIQTALKIQTTRR